MMTPPTGAQYELRHGDQRAVAVQLGAGIRTYTAGGRPLLDGYAGDVTPPAAKGLPLIPWPNRIRDGRYTFGGRELVAPINEPERHNAIHGFTRDAMWTAAETMPDAVTLTHAIEPTPAYPFRLASAVRYSLDDQGLRCETRLENVGEGPLPVAAGHHPYFTAGAPPMDGWLLTIPALVYLELDDRMIPTGRSLDPHGLPFDFRTERPIGDQSLDTCYTGLQRDGDGKLRCRLRARGQPGVTVWMGPEVTHVMVYTGDAIGRTGVAIEPMTCPPNAFQSGDGVAVLGRGQIWGYDWGVTPQA